MHSERPIRILHIVGGMNRGGVETWLMHVLRHIDRDRFQMDFLVHTTKPCDFDDEIRALGSQVIPCLHPSRPFVYARNLRRLLREHGPYDVVHSHVHHYSGWTLSIAHRAGIPLRIAHSHNDTSSMQATAAIVRRAYLRLMRYWIHQHATHKLSASQSAAAALYGKNWHIDPQLQLLFYGIDLAAFRSDVDRSDLRARLGMPSDVFVLGHVGRFQEQKNHRFLIRVAAEICAREKTAIFLLVGDGPLRSEIELQVERMGLTDRIIFAGLRSDVPALMKGVMDVFVFPSLYEGLGIVLLEAQAAGLPCVVSDVVPEEADIVPQLITRLSLGMTAANWAESILAQRNSNAYPSSKKSLEAVEQSAFNITASVQKLEAIYRA